MKTIDFDFYLPRRLIAQFPSEKRDDCRLLYLDTARRSIEHHLFTDLPRLLKPGDHIVFNDTKVLPAAMVCRKETGARIELLFTEKMNDRTWKALAKPSKRIRKNSVLFDNDHPEVRLLVGDNVDEGIWLISAYGEAEERRIEDILQRYGRIPLPHYIRRAPEPSDRQTYQTIFADKNGAIAAPTAGLHFSEESMYALRRAGIFTSLLTLHVGIGTFRPVTVDDPRNHPMHEERYMLSAETASLLASTRKNGGRIIAVGTTVVRVLEHCAGETGHPVPSAGATRLLILPGYQFKAIDGMITNFHVPKSTLLMLVCAFAGTEFTLDAYREAVKREYRFFSYGDAMMIL